MKIPYDKKLHLGTGFIFALIGSLLFTPLVGLVIAVIAGMIKELYDWIDYGGRDWKDLLATMAGGAIGAFIVLLKRWIQWTY